MRYKMTYILFLFFLLTTIPYIITIYINKENKKNISFENYDSGYKIQDKDQDIDLESYLLKILPKTNNIRINWEIVPMRSWIRNEKK